MRLTAAARGEELRVPDERQPCMQGRLAGGERGRQRALEVVVQEEQVVEQVVPDQRLARGAQRAPHACPRRGSGV